MTIAEASKAVVEKPEFSIMTTLVRGGKEKLVKLRAASDRFADVQAARREQYPGWSIYESGC
ncbi:MAG: hypothetical protein AAF329_01935 [Cyanobacteria bacterium P01_A01_bin.17]